MITSLRARLLNILIALDQFVYVLLTLGHGSPDETMSAAAYRLWLRDQIGGRYFKPATTASDPTAPSWSAGTCRGATRDEQDHDPRAPGAPGALVAAAAP